MKLENKKEKKREKPPNGLNTYVGQVVSHPELKVDMWQQSHVLEWILFSRKPAKNPQDILISKPV